MNLEIIFKSLKQPARQVLLALYAFGLNKVLELAAVKFGFVFTEEQKIQLMAYGTTVVWAILSYIDKHLHEVGKTKEASSTKKSPITSRLTKGITRF